MRQAAEGAVELASVETLASWVTPGACTGLAVRAVLWQCALDCKKSLFEPVAGCAARPMTTGTRGSPG